MGLQVRAPGALDDVRGAPFHAGLHLPELAPGSFQLIDVKGHQLAVVRAETLVEATTLGARAREQGASFVVALLPTSFEVALKGLVEAKSLDLVLASRPKDELAAEQNRLLGGEIKLAQLQNKGRSLLRIDLTLRDDQKTTWLKGSGEQERDLATLDERIELLRGQVNDPGASEELRALKKTKLDDLLQRRFELANAPITWPATGNAAAFRFVAIETTLPKDPRVEAIEQAYDRDVGELNLGWAREHGKACDAPSAEHPGFVGTMVCGACHPDALKVWQGTKHPHAFTDLEAKGKQYHLDCIGCHVAGWQQPGGVCRIDQTEQRREVGCESCHGPGSAHVALPTKATIHRGAKEVCVGCHDRENSTHFEYESYVAKIRGPGHGAPK
jgi:predicted CXXCH cytochrome family protein